MATNSRAGFLQDCRTTMAGVDQNTADLAHVQTDRATLGELVVKIDEGIMRQNFHLGQAQQATRDVEDAVRQSRDLLVRLKNAIRAFYGLRSEKLQEFGLVVRRFVRKSVESKKKPSGVGPTQPPTAASETDGTIQK
ncbi:MAG: hypothetical protein ACJ76J_13070 [Thermoanaerobaculia bacterium]